MFDSGRSYFLGRSHIRLAPNIIWEPQLVKRSKQWVALNAMGGTVSYLR